MFHPDFSQVERPATQRRRRRRKTHRRRAFHRAQAKQAARFGIVHRGARLVGERQQTLGIGDRDLCETRQLMGKLCSGFYAEPVWCWLDGNTP
jgi:hypothetical protein